MQKEKMTMQGGLNIGLVGYFLVMI